MSRFLDARLAGMSPYIPGEQPKFGEYIKLNTNESPFPPSKSVLDILRGEDAARLNLYSDTESTALVSAISAFYGVPKEQIIAGNGSDEILSFCFQAFCGAEKGACYPDITYGFYKVYARLFGLDTKIIPLNNDFSVPAKDFFGAGKTVFLANPNAPTGLFLPLSEIERILRNNRESVVVIDEAYVDFGGESAVKLTEKYENLVVVQTFSKARNLAGARIGFAIAQKPVTDDLRLIKNSLNPYNVNTLSNLAGAASMADVSYFRECTGRIIATRRRVQDELSARGFDMTDSSANFIFAKHPSIAGGDLYLKLKEKGILIRHFDKARISGHIRITVGTDSQMDRLIAAIDEILEGKK